MFEHQCIICRKTFEDDNQFSEECPDCQDELAEENYMLGEEREMLEIFGDEWERDI